MDKILNQGNFKKQAAGGDTAAAAAKAAKSRVIKFNHGFKCMCICTMCCESLPEDKIPHIQGHAHNSASTVCATCIVHHAREEIQGKMGVANVRCLQSGCKMDISPSDLRAAGLSSDLLDMLDRRQRDAFIASMPNFRWCTRPGCGNGYELHDPQAYNIMNCKHCGQKTCAIHRVHFHEGLTCQEYDLPQLLKQAGNSQQDKLSEHWIRANCKRCPQCATPIEKNEGCDHMTCKLTSCKHEFCWLCLADYNKIRKEGNDAHATTCRYHSRYIV